MPGYGNKRRDPALNALNIFWHCPMISHYFGFSGVSKSWDWDYKYNKDWYFNNIFDVTFTNAISHLHKVEKRDLEFEKAIGDKVRELRENLGWSQKRLGDLANLEQNQIQRVEKARNSSSLAIITAIAKALGKQPYEILKTEFKVQVNTNVEKVKKPRTSGILHELARTSFFNSPKAVLEVIAHCKKEYGIVLNSSATSGILKKMSEEKLLKRIPSKIKGRYLYKKSRKTGRWRYRSWNYESNEEIFSLQIFSTIPCISETRSISELNSAAVII